MLWENWVVSEFMKKNLLNGQLANLYFWRTRSQSEVDLVVKSGSQLSAYEIKWKQTGNASRAFEDQYKTKVEFITSANPFLPDF